MKKYVVYAHMSPHGKLYIGITCRNPLERWGRNGKRYENNLHFNNAIQKYGWDGFIHAILFDNLSEEEARQKEIYLIRLYDTTNPSCGYNIVEGGGGTVGYRHTSDSKNRIALAHTGMKMSDETKRKISQANSGKTRKGGGRKKGYKVSEETIQRMRESHKGQVPWNKGLKHN